MIKICYYVSVRERGEARRRQTMKEYPNQAILALAEEIVKLTVDALIVKRHVPLEKREQIVEEALEIVMPKVNKIMEI